jgi:hypothetical protein
MQARGVPESLTEEREHGLQHLRRRARRRCVVEVDLAHRFKSTAREAGSVTRSSAPMLEETVGSATEHTDARGADTQTVRVSSSVLRAKRARCVRWRKN